VILLGIILAAILVQARLIAREQPLVFFDVARGFPSQLGGARGVDVTGADAEAVKRAYAPAMVLYRDYTKGDGTTVTLLVEPLWNRFKDLDNCLPYYGYQQAAEQETEIPRAGRTSESIITDNSGGFMACSMAWHVPGHLYSRRDRLDVVRSFHNHEELAVMEACKDADSLKEAASMLPEVRGFLVQASTELDALHSSRLKNTVENGVDKN